MLEADFSGQSMFVANDVPSEVEIQVATGQLAWPSVVVFRGLQGRRRRTDILMSMGYIHAVSDRFVQLLCLAGCTGWQARSAEVYDTAGECWPGYHTLIVPGRIITAYSKASTTPEWLGQRGLFFDESDWDGNDFFWVDRLLCFTQRIHDLVSQHKLTNVPCTRLADTEWPAGEFLEK